MARKSYKKRFYRRKGRWSANIRTITNESVTAPSGSFFSTLDLCLNPPQDSTTVSQQFTVKNVELSYEIDSDASLNFAEGLTSYIMFVPQGMTVTETYPNFHPEFIMAMKFLGSPSINNDLGVDPPQGLNTGRNPLKIKTRLARRLQTGDKIILLIVGTNITDTQATLKYNGIIRWWTKAN